ncbi:peptide/nickel transport system substrate-binding protein [Spinactinospora alkalitolerans]|uniref:Peptide/nickel transport system substrate-binding protein n=1 Tax=Spinactinospora alkalitolerans TaxID=687207 RepID=A0A852TVI0_9ACTN|nr:ABC transporter substrate-binding protein [Spinactinospora alkalitolerans]NYE46094.1 peptide/nickel transport system substrate-binding protein [Spinactinospora alkalitolerans]
MPSLPRKPDRDPRSAPAHGTTRRDVLRFGAAGAVVAPALVACGSAANPDAYVRQQDYDDPRRGGRLRIGIAGGSAADSIDAHIAVDNTDIARVFNLYDTLCAFGTDYAIEMALAESIEPNAEATVWTVVLREGVKFHDGRDITAADVAFSLRRITDPDDPKTGAAGFATLDRDGIEAVDERTVKVPFTEATVNLLDVLAEYYSGIVPQDYDPAAPVGSGPFKYQDFTAGVRSLFTRFDEYWREGEPFVDELEIINFPDDTARVNALLGGQVEAISQLPHSQVKVVDAYDHLAVLESESGQWLPFTMRVDSEPFDDVRVRQAFRLIVDRQQMIDQALSGYGSIGNDLYARFDPAYADDLPQREQDIEEAKRLLAEAGHGDGLEVELVTGPINAGVVEAAQVFAEQAKAAGVTVNLRRVTSEEFYGDNYLKWDFAQDFWGTRNYVSQAAQGSLPDAPFNETHWADEEWIDLVKEAQATVDDDERAELLHSAQEIEYERGGYIVWGFTTVIDGYNANVKGFEPSVTGHPLTGYRFRGVWFETK